MAEKISLDEVKEKRIVISFPGGRGDEIPLLYFGAKVFEDRGYEKIFIKHPEGKNRNSETLYENAKNILEKIDFSECEDVIFVAKSIGTVVACKLKEELGLTVPLILFTPLQETLPYLKEKNNILLVAAGTKDRYLDAEMLQEVCLKENIPCYIEPKVGHRMEVMNDLPRNLEIVGNVIGKVVEMVAGKCENL